MRKQRKFPRLENRDENVHFSVKFPRQNKTYKVNFKRIRGSIRETLNSERRKEMEQSTGTASPNEITTRRVERERSSESNADETKVILRAVRQLVLSGVLKRPYRMKYVHKTRTTRQEVERSRKRKIRFRAE